MFLCTESRTGDFNPLILKDRGSSSSLSVVYMNGTQTENYSVVIKALGCVKEEKTVY